MNAYVRNALSIHPATAAMVTLDSLIPDRARALGCTDFSSYCDLIDKEATAHLEGFNLVRVTRLRAYRRPRPYLERSTGTHCLSIPLNRNLTMFCKVDASDWIEVQELGVNGVWLTQNNGKGCLSVITKTPMRDYAPTNTIAAARLILGLGAGEQVGFADGDSLNLRRGNLFTCVQPQPAAKSRLRRARHDARQVAREAVALRDRLTTT